MNSYISNQIEILLNKKKYRTLLLINITVPTNRHFQSINNFLVLIKNIYHESDADVFTISNNEILVFFDEDSSLILSSINKTINKSNTFYSENNISIKMSLDFAKFNSKSIEKKLFSLREINSYVKTNNTIAFSEKFFINYKKQFDNNSLLYKKDKQYYEYIIEENSSAIIKNETFNIPKLLTSLPPRNESFVGRQKELSIIENILNNDSMTYIVNGMGGVGKSELSYNFLHKNKEKYKAIAFLEMTTNTLSIEDIFYSKFKDSFGFDKNTTFDTIIKTLQSLPPKNLLLIDNLESKEDFEKIKSLNANFDLLITTRLTNIETKNQLKLDTLNKNDAKELFLSIYNKDMNIEDILNYLDNHPLYLILTAKSLVKEYITLKELRNNIQNNTISKIDSTNDKTFKEHLEDTFDRQFKKESNEEIKKLLQVLSIFPSIEVSFEVIEKCTGIEKLKVQLQKLVERGWLTKKENSYKLHQIIKTFIQTDYKLDYDEIKFILNKIGNFIDPDDSALIASQLNNYIPILEHLENNYKEKRDINICKILDSLTYLYYSLEKYKESLSYQEESLIIKQEIPDKDSKQLVKSFNLLSLIHKAMGYLDKALEFQNQALRITKETQGNSSSDLAKRYNNLSLIYINMGNLKQALEYQEQAVILYKEVFSDKHPDLATSYNNISIIYKDMGNLKQALEYQEQSLLLYKEIFGEKYPDLATSYNNISIIYKDMGNLKQALEYQEQSLLLYKEVLGKNHPSLITSFNNISTIYLELSHFDKALEYQKKALELQKRILGGNHTSLAVIYNNISLIYQNLRECSKAKEFILEAINIWRQSKYHKKELINASLILKRIEFNLKKESKIKTLKKKGRFCRD